MKADLPKREAEILKFWEEIDPYHLVQQKNAGRPKFILHDGPPYANGDIHLGQALNKILKDIVVRYKSLRGFDAPYLPGWDTHGLPTEHQVITQFNIDRHQVHPLDWRRKCRDFSLKFVEIQKAQFQRLGVRGDWDDAYLTLDPAYEAAELEVFCQLVEKDQVYRGLKPVYWCWSCETALAEAEVEFETKESTSIHVLFPLQKSPHAVFPALKRGERVSVIIWTTTPWTLPGNVAVAVHPQAGYSLVRADGRTWLLASDLLGQVARELDWGHVELVGEAIGRDLEGLKMAHPIFEKESVIILADYVSLEEGTGCVHTAPGHGREDFASAQKYGLPVISPLDEQGRFTAEGGPFADKLCYAADADILQFLKERGLLLKEGTIKHQYAHCWRCKSPVIFRATEQWFMKVEEIREGLLRCLEEVEWIPPGSKARIGAMLETRPDWCLSRQRVWGVGLPAFFCRECGEALLTPQSVQKVANLVRKEGSDIWFSPDAIPRLTKGLSCAHCGSTRLAPGTDIVDVWFDSGTSYAAILETNPRLAFPADLYLEGSDQHRGWFQTSLLTSFGSRGCPPYRAVLTHGFFVDEEGRKMSKSRMDAVRPETMMETYGADILRLWVSCVDFTKDLRISPEILGQVAEAYRRIRNTLRFMLGNLYDFQPAAEGDFVGEPLCGLPNNSGRPRFDRLTAPSGVEGQRAAPTGGAQGHEEMPAIDRWLLLRLRGLIERVTKAYDDYALHIVYHEIQNFCAVDLSAVYFSIIKDRLYTEPADSPGRRSAQTALYLTLGSLLVMLAPILPFTTEEAYQLLPAKPNPTVQLEEWPLPQGFPLDEQALERWELLFQIRTEVLRALEAAKNDGVIRDPLESLVSISCDGPAYQALLSLAGQLNSFFVVSQVCLGRGSEELPFSVEVAPAEGQKCQRCWLVSPAVGLDSEHPSICARCRGVLVQVDPAGE